MRLFLQQKLCHKSVSDIMARKAARIWTAHIKTVSCQTVRLIVSFRIHDDIREFYVVGYVNLVVAIQISTFIPFIYNSQSRICSDGRCGKAIFGIELGGNIIIVVIDVFNCSSVRRRNS